MQYLRVTSLHDAVAALHEHPDAIPVAGGTDVMVQLNQGHIRPAVLLDISRVPELSCWGPRDGFIEVGATITYTRLLTEAGTRLPGLTAAARTVGSPQIRNRGTIGGSLGTASPTGDVHPSLLAAGALIQIVSQRGYQHVAAADFYADPAGARPADALIASVLIPAPIGLERFGRTSDRATMAPTAAAFALSLEPVGRRVGCGAGAAVPAPTPVADAAEFLTGELAVEGLWDSRADIKESVVTRFGDLVAGHATAGYPRRALAVLARRALTDAWAEYQEAGRCA
jgi:CO/xanthine dehydrogenase FAD-binding subunit